MSRDLTNFHDIENTPAGVYRGLLTLREDFDSHIHDGTNSKTFETIHVRTLIADSSVLSTRSLAVVKKNYSDATAGFWVGLDSATAKLFLGNLTNYVKWTGTALQISGEITATTGTIGGFTIGATTLSANESAIILNSSASTIGCTTLAANTVNAGAVNAVSSSTIPLAVTQNSATGAVPAGRIYQKDLDKTALFIHSDTDFTESNNAFIEIDASSGLMTTALRLSSRATSAHILLNAIDGPAVPADGQIWFSGADLFIRIGGTTYTLDKTAV